MPEIVQITVKTKAEDLLRFMLFHAYSKMSGLMTLGLSVLALVLLPFSIFLWQDTFVTLALGLLVFIYLILTPINMFSQSKRQVASNPIFKNPITYHISEEIFEVQQYTGTLRLYWSQLIRIRKTPFDYLFYVNNEQAFVVPKKQVEPDDTLILEKILLSIKDELNKEPIKPDSAVNFKNKGKDNKSSNRDKQLKDLANRVIETGKINETSETTKATKTDK